MIAERPPGARIETAPGRLVVEAGEAAGERDRGARTQHRATTSDPISPRWREGTAPPRASDGPTSCDALPMRFTTATGVRIDLTRPDLEIGIELRGNGSPSIAPSNSVCEAAFTLGIRLRSTPLSIGSRSAG